MLGSGTRPRGLLALGVAAVLVAAACGGSDGDAGSAGGDAGDTTTSAPTTTAPATTAADAGLTVLVTNDDGVTAPGLDALVEGLRGVRGVEVVVVAPDRDRSGTGGSTTPGGVTPSAATTASGREATAVDGFPADAVAWALGGGLDEPPDVVLSGINAGQNVGPFVAISGTVGAATAAAAAGVPALAVSQGKVGDGPLDYTTAVRLALEWLDGRRAALAERSPGGPVTLDNLNVPTCIAGTVRGVLEVPVEPGGAAPPGAVDCSTPPPAPAPADDVTAFAAGWATRSALPVPAATTGG